MVGEGSQGCRTQGADEQPLDGPGRIWEATRRRMQTPDAVQRIEASASKA